MGETTFEKVVKSGEMEFVKKVSEINFEFKLMPDGPSMAQLPKKLKYSNKQKTIVTIKKHVYKHTNEPINNIEVLCRGIPLGDQHMLEWVKKTIWQEKGSVLVLTYRQKINSTK